VEGILKVQGRSSEILFTKMALFRSYIENKKATPQIFGEVASEGMTIEDK